MRCNYLIYFNICYFPISTSFFCIHNNLSITASTYNRRGDFVFRGLDFSGFLSIFIKPSRRANILKEVLLWKSKSHYPGWPPKKPKDCFTIWTPSLCSRWCTPVVSSTKKNCIYAKRKCWKSTNRPLTRTKMSCKKGSKSTFAPPRVKKLAFCTLDPRKPSKMHPLLNFVSKLGGIFKFWPNFEVSPPLSVNFLCFSGVLSPLLKKRIFYDHIIKCGLQNSFFFDYCGSKFECIPVHREG